MATPFVVHFHPVAFSIGPVHVHWYGLMYLGGFLGGWALGEYRRRQGRLPVSADRFGDLMFYAMMGVAFALVCAAWGARFRGSAIVLFVIQLAINLAWTPVFFALHELKLALAIILALDVAVLVTTALFWRVRRLAGWLMVPYILWILFATVLNWQFLALNPLADGANGSYAVQRIQL